MSSTREGGGACILLQWFLATMTNDHKLQVHVYVLGTHFYSFQIHKDDKSVVG